MGKTDVLPADAPFDGRFDLEPAPAPINLAQHLRVIVDQRLLIVLVAGSVTALGALYALVKPASYEGNLLIQVEDMRTVEPKTLLGMTALGSGYRRALAETELLRSRAIVGAVVDRLQLDVSATPVYFPVIGAPLARWNARSHVLPGGGPSGYAWGAEAIQVGKLEVGAALLDTPLTVTSGGKGIYRLEHAPSGRSFSGQLGRELRVSIGASSVRLRVDRLSAAPDVRFTLVRHGRDAVVEDMVTALKIAELGKETGMLRVSLQGADPQRVSAFLNTLGQVYMERIGTQKARESSAWLEALNQRLPGLRARVAQAEARLVEYQRRPGAVDVGEDTRLQLARASAAREKLAQLRLQRAELAVRLGEQHPVLRALDQQVAGVSSDVQAVSADMQRIPVVASELERRARALKSETDIYNAVLRRVDELDVDAQDRSSNVRIVDDAVVPFEPAQSRSLIVLFAALLGLALGIGAAFLRTMRRGA